MLKLDHISKTFNPGTLNEKKALDQVDLHLERGDFVTIVGSNGAGKSTLFNAIAGSFLVDSGCILVDGQISLLWPSTSDPSILDGCSRTPCGGLRPT